MAEYVFVIPAVNHPGLEAEIREVFGDRVTLATGPAGGRVGNPMTGDLIEEPDADKIKVRAIADGDLSVAEVEALATIVAGHDPAKLMPHQEKHTLSRAARIALAENLHQRSAALRGIRARIDPPEESIVELADTLADVLEAMWGLLENSG